MISMHLATTLEMSQSLRTIAKDIVASLWNVSLIADAAKSQSWYMSLFQYRHTVPVINFLALQPRVSHRTCKL